MEIDFAEGRSGSAAPGDASPTGAVPLPPTDQSSDLAADTSTGARGATPANDEFRSLPASARDRVARSLLMDGPASAVELADRLHITPVAIRRHVDSLEADGLIVGGDRPAYGPSPNRGRGRPPKFFSLTEAGRDCFDQSYDDLAVSALRFLEEQGGEAAVTAFSETRGKAFEERYVPLVAAAGPRDEDRVQALVEAMTQDGFAATVVEADAEANIQICQHNCPVAHVAEQFPVLCEQEAAAMQRVLGVNVTRLATIAHGDGVCTSVVSLQRSSPQTRSARSMRKGTKVPRNSKFSKSEAKR